MAHDRTDGDDLPIIHDFLALMLGVRRAGVTTALHELERAGLIKANRGRIRVLDRKGLEGAANGADRVAEAEYERRMNCRAPFRIRLWLYLLAGVKALSRSRLLCAPVSRLVQPRSMLSAPVSGPRHWRSAGWH